MTSQDPPVDDSVSPYLRIKLRDAPKPRVLKLQEQPAEPDSETPPREVPPLARPGAKL